MRPLRFLVPGTTGRFRCGGLLVELQTARLTSSLAPSAVVTYRQREEGLAFLPDLLRQEPAPGPALWIVSWGFDVPGLLKRLQGRPVAYHAHSSGYGFDLPPGVPVLAVSRNTLGYWGNRAPRQPLHLLPNALAPQWLRPVAVAAQRPIDVLVHRRKCSDYVLTQLVPALRQRGLRVEVQDGWVEDLVGLFHSATVVIYDSADYWRSRGISEGFGLPPIEALASGCVVFSSLNHALADTLDPGLVGHQIGAGTLAADLDRIAAAAADPAAWRPDPARLAALLAECSEPVLLERWRSVLEQVNQHWDRLLAPDAAPPLRSPSVWRLRLARQRQRLAHAVGRFGF
ncbi:MAG: glycosyltransferase family 1 protein [Cyanobacteriota bacterium]